MLREMFIQIGIVVLICSITVDAVDNVVAKKVPKKVVNKTLYLAVHSMAGFEKYILNPRLLNLASESAMKVQNERGEVKKKLCATIFAHPAMVALQGVDVIDPADEQVQEELRTKRSDLFNFYYNGSKFQNDYRKYNFSIGGGIVPDYVYPCLARNRASSNIEEYLVTIDYLIPRDNVLTGHERKVAARFVLLRKEDMNETVLIAMSDKTTEDVAPPHPNYCDKTELTEEGKSKDLCELVDMQQIRLCATLLNSKKYVEMYSAPYKVGVTGCRESKLLLQCGAEKEDLQFSDTVLECQADWTETDSNRPATYYISRGIKPHQFFVAVSMANSTVPVLTHVFYSYHLKANHMENY